jgi:RND family efflux transporter MFP subunit
VDTQDTGRSAVRSLHSGREAEERLLWRQFREARGAEAPEPFYQSWLAIQCDSIEKVRAGLLLTRSRRSGAFTPAAHWPADQRPGAHVRAAAERVLQEKRALALGLEPQGEAAGSGGSRTIIAQPVLVADEVEAVVVLDVEARAEVELERALRQLGWGCAWLELRVVGGAGRPGESLSALLEMIGTPLEHERFEAAATAFVTELATRFGCERVGLGHFERGRVKLLALSHSAQFDKRANFTRRLEAAMEEAVDRGAEVTWPPTSGMSPQATPAHEALAREAEGGAVCSCLVARGSRFCGVVTLERGADRPFTEEELELIDPAVGMAGAILEIHRRDDRSLLAKVLDSARSTAADLVGPRHVALKLTSAVIVLVVAFLALAKGDFRVTGDLTLEARVLRAAVAPFDGYILEAPVRAGDQVKEGDLLVLLDDRDIALERARYASQLEQLGKEYRQALAERDSSSVRITAARIDQIRAQHDLAVDQLSRTRIQAPFDGIVVTGDLSQQLGSPVARGDLLFEVAPLDEYRPVLEVDERDIDEVAVGQKGQLVFSAFPDAPVGFSVEKITPVSSAKEGRNTFRVEARLDQTPERLRPGMEGVAKVEVDRRRLLWIWTHEAVDWLRLALWSWLP